jgi:uridylate kinase
MADEGTLRRVLLKLSGGTLAGADGSPFDGPAISWICRELQSAHETGVQIAVVVGGGNILRGAKLHPTGPGRIRADYAGMLATAVNILVLRDHLAEAGVPVAHYCAFAVPRMCDAFEPERCRADLEAGRLVLLGGGTGNPLFTTDSAAALRAAEIGASVVLKATRVDGVYSDDPEENPDAERFERLTYGEVLERELGVMDLTAISFCLEHSLPVRVFDYAREGNIRRAVLGEPVGTLVGSPEDAG